MDDGSVDVMEYQAENSYIDTLEPKSKPVEPKSKPVQPESKPVEPTPKSVEPVKITYDIDDKCPPEPPLLYKVIAEIVGTFILVFFGCGAVCQVKYTGAMVGLGQVTTTFALGGALGIYACGSISGGHLNPAVTLAFALVRPKDFPFRNVVPYWIAQVAGAFGASSLLYYFFYWSIKEFEANEGIVRGQYGHSFAGAFGCYWSEYVIGAYHAILLEMMGTGMLTFVVFSITHKNNNVPASLVPVLVGITIGSVIAIIGSMSGGAINPARDFGPRLLTYIQGWGEESFDHYWVYTLGPLIGGFIGAFYADECLRSSS